MANKRSSINPQGIQYADTRKISAAFFKIRVTQALTDNDVIMRSRIAGRGMSLLPKTHGYRSKATGSLCDYNKYNKARQDES